LHPDIVMMHLLYKWFMENYLCWYAHGEVFVRNKRMEEQFNLLSIQQLIDLYLKIKCIV
jgi:hypothetical protein